MSSYNTRWCEKHGEWEQDVDDQYAECPQCVEEGITPTQLAYKATLAREAEIKKLMDEIERLRGLLREHLLGPTEVMTWRQAHEWHEDYLKRVREELGDGG